MVGNTVNCEQVWREISNYVDGEVNANLRASMEEHLRTCKHCASVLAGVRNVVQLYGDERMLEVPAGFSSRMQRRLAKNSAVQRSRWLSWSAWLVPLAAMVLITATLVMTGSSRNALRSQHAEQAKDIPPDMVVVVSSGAKLFHVPGCPFIHDKATERTLSAKAAMSEGYVPCPRCLRKYLKTGLTRETAGDDATAEAEEQQEQTLAVTGH
jgi:hypothetical protein